MRLTPEEREVVVTYNDAEKTWHVFSDSAATRGKILRLAQQVGAKVERLGEGVESGPGGGGGERAKEVSL